MRLKPSEVTYISLKYLLLAYLLLTYHKLAIKPYRTLCSGKVANGNLGGTTFQATPTHLKTLWDFIEAFSNPRSNLWLRISCFLLQYLWRALPRTPVPSSTHSKQQPSQVHPVRFKFLLPCASNPSKIAPLLDVFFLNLLSSIFFSHSFHLSFCSFPLHHIGDNQGDFVHNGDFETGHLGAWQCTGSHCNILQDQDGGFVAHSHLSQSDHA